MVSSSSWMSWWWKRNGFWMSFLSFLSFTAPRPRMVHLRWSAPLRRKASGDSVLRKTRGGPAGQGLGLGPRAGSRPFG